MISTVFALLFAVSGASAADTCTVLAPQAGEATFYFPDQIVKNGAVVIRDGLIADALPTLEGIRITGEGEATRATWNGLSCEFVDVANRVVSPGFVAVSTQLGVVEVGLEKGSRDDSAAEIGPVRSNFRVSDGYNPRSSLIPVTRLHGITSATVHPGGGLVSGQVAWVDLNGDTQAKSVVNTSVAMVAQPDWMRLENLLDEVRYYAKNRAAYDQNRTRPLATPRSQLAALLPVVQMDQPLVLSVNRAADIEAAIRFQAKQRIRIVLDGAAEGWMVASALAEAEIPVIVDPLLNAPQSFDSIGGREDNAALLRQAGVPVILTAYSSHNARTLRQVAGNAVRGGLDHHEAILAVTQTPADVFGLKKHGRLEPGTRANVVVWSGDPLELNTSVQALFIGGQSVPLDSRQIRLMERYRQLPGTPLQPLDAPE